MKIQYILGQYCVQEFEIVVFLKLSHQFEKKNNIFLKCLNLEKTYDTMNFREQLLHIPLINGPGIAEAVLKTPL